MIRINLLPVRESERQKSGRQFLLLCAILLIGEIFGLFLVQSAQDDELKILQQQNAQIQRKIKRLKKKTKQNNRRW